MSEPFVAEIRMSGFNFPPRGYASCDGQLIPISQNTALFSLLGINFGGDGRTTFGLPDLRGRAPMHTGSGPGLTSRVVGETGGAPTVTLSSSELPPHTHGLSVAAAADGVADRSNAAGNVLAKPADPTYATGAANAAMSAGSTAPAGGNGAHNNMQPYLVINFFIALQGIFPPRP